MDFTDWLEYEYKNPILDDYDYFLARRKFQDIFRSNIFFIGLNPRWQLYKWLPKGVNVMYSAYGFWNNDKKEWRKGKKFKRSFGLRWLDCGGFTMLNQFADYPFSVVNYANLVARLKPHYYATMDYPCEPEISRSLNLMTNAQRIKATVDNARRLAYWENQLPGQMVPVIQGYSLAEYVECLRLYDKVGLIRDYMAVGSMCRRMNDRELGELIPGIHHAAQSFGVTKLHFFGLKLNKKVQKYDNFIWSRDSAASLMSADVALRKTWGGRRFPMGQTEKQEAFEYFLRKLERLGLKYLNVD